MDDALPVDDFEDALAVAWRGLGEWKPPLLTPEMRRRLVELPQTADKS